MDLNDYEERFWWKKIYLASIKAGKSDYSAHCAANDAVTALRSVPVVRRPQPHV